VGFSQLLKCFEVLGFEVQDTTFGVCGGFERSLVFGHKTRCFVYSLGGLKSHSFKHFFDHPPIRVWKKSQPFVATYEE